MHQLKSIRPALLLFMAGLVIFLVNSCKKDKVGTLSNYLTDYGDWKLASLQVTHFRRYTTSTTDTLSYACGANEQTFHFDSNNSIYTDFQCNGKSYTGSWTIDTDSLLLRVPIQMPDTSSSKSTSQPFLRSRIINLGRNSLVLLIGDINSYYPDDKTHAVYRYSFIHQGE